LAQSRWRWIACAVISRGCRWTSGSISRRCEAAKAYTSTQRRRGRRGPQRKGDLV
jgi:hypothetical protein